MPSGSSSAPPPSLTTHTPKKPRQADLSRTISQRWKALSPEERTHWEDLAKEKKRQHEMLHPNYVYRPRRSGAKNRSSATTSTGWATQPRKHSVPPPPQQIEFVLPTPRPHARSASVPPYQAVQVPNVYAQSPSGSSSDAGGDDPAGLMALILQQHGMQNNAGGLGFDYVPTNLNFETLEVRTVLSFFLRLSH